MDKPEFQTFGRWLTFHRKKARYSQRALGKEAGVSGTYIGKLEKNDDLPHEMSPRPSQDVVERVSLALGADARQGKSLAGWGINQPSATPDDDTLTFEQKLKLWEEMGARTLRLSDLDETDYELPEDPDDWSTELREALNEALFYTRLIPAEFVRPLLHYWRDQARAHAGIAVDRKAMESSLRSNTRKKD